MSGLADRSSRSRTTPTHTPLQTELRIAQARVDEHAGARVLAGLLELPASTIGAVLRRCDMPYLRELDRLTSEIVPSRTTDVRYEHDRPGELLLHVDVEKLGKVPDDGGWRLQGRSEDCKDRGIGWDSVQRCRSDGGAPSPAAHGETGRPSGLTARCRPSGPTPSRGPATPSAPPP